MNRFKRSLMFLWVVAAVHVACAEIQVHVERLGVGASRNFSFPTIPRPARQDSASQATLKILRGTADPNSGGLSVLNDGRVPSDEDVPRQNFFFSAGSGGGRVLIDLGVVTAIRQIASYSWHPAERGPQVYALFGAETVQGDRDLGTATPPADFRLIARVDTRTKEGAEGGQHGVAIRDSSGLLGSFRYLLLDIAPTEDNSRFAQTFFSEIDVLSATDKAEEAQAPEPIVKPIEVLDGAYRYEFDLSDAPDLEDWTRQKLVPVVKEWYPRLVAMLPSDGYQAPTNVLIRYRTDMRGTPASASGSRVNCNADWFRRNLEGEAAGSVVHELVHVVQNYGWGRRNNPAAARTPGWIVEGIPDYIRWFLYEPQTKGAEITRNNLVRARYDASYRITGNFLNWLVHKHGPELVQKLNAAARAGNYRDTIWIELAGKPVEQLGAEWKAFHELRLAPPLSETGE